MSQQERAFWQVVRFAAPAEAPPEAWAAGLVVGLAAVDALTPAAAPVVAWAAEVVSLMAASPLVVLVFAVVGVPVEASVQASVEAPVHV